MTPHAVNFDAIAAGARAVLDVYPHMPAERRPPRGAHAVLWADDWWRGVDMMREACELVFGKNSDTTMEVEHRRRVCDRVLQRPVDDEGAHLPIAEAEQADLLFNYFENLVVTGDIERESRGPIHQPLLVRKGDAWVLRACDDPELIADELEEA